MYINNVRQLEIFSLSSSSPSSCRVLSATKSWKRQIHAHLPNEKPVFPTAMAEVNPQLARLLAEPSVARLIAARPHVYPPCVNPPFVHPFQYEKGLPTRPRSDATSMTNHCWQANRCRVVDWCVIIVEFALNGVRQSRLHGRPATLNVCYGKWDNCFANCMVCWQQQKRDFSDSDKTPHPYSVPTSNPGTPQLGVCGCVICNECLTEQFARRPDKTVISCPYCAELGSYNLDVKAWIVCAAVSEKFEKDGFFSG
jgi:hypothetical protein